MSEANRIQAIETRYKGYRFRSRLEARWAVFFDALGIEWKYEPEGYEISIGDGITIRYLPDFYLPKFGVFVEVKGSMSLQDASKLRNLFTQGFLSQFKSKFLLLGNVPEPIQGNHFHRFITHTDQIHYGYAFFGLAGSGQIFSIQEEAADWLHDATGEGKSFWFETETNLSSLTHEWKDRQILSCFDTEAISISSKFPRIDVVEAYRAARSARFEHGENGGAP